MFFGTISGSKLTSGVSESTLLLSESGTLSLLRDKWWPESVSCPVPGVSESVTLDPHHMSIPLIFISAAILLTIILVLIEILSDKSIVSIPNYLRRKLSNPQSTKYICDYEPRTQKHRATQTILWASRSSSPGEGLPPLFSSLNHKLYTSDGQLAKI